MKRLMTAAGALALVVGTMIGFAPAAGAWGGPSGTRWVHPGQSIQAAINAVGPGGTVFVAFGTYREQLVITRTVHIVAFGAKLVPPASAGAPSPCSAPDPNDDGVCIAGDITADSEGNVIVNHYVYGVSISGLTIAGFGGTGIMQIGGAGSTFTSDAAVNNDEYGIAAFDSTGTTEQWNFASGGGEAGFYIGDSHPANARLAGNTTVGNQFGVFIRDAEGVKVLGNNIKGNCLGLFVLADAPGPAGNALIAGNAIRQNNKACPASEEGPPISGIGVAIAGGHDVFVTGNGITGNVPSGPSIAAGGVVVITAPGGVTPPMNNHIQGNVISFNQADITWDNTGTGNVFKPNACFANAQPTGLC